MTFSCDRAFRRLKRTGWVLSARASYKEEQPVWINRGRGETKEFDAVRTRVAILDRSQFHEFARSTLYAEQPRYVLAGFTDAAGWIEKVRELQDGEIPETVYVYRVVREDFGEGKEAVA
jgi:hypothetical protein